MNNLRLRIHGSAILFALAHLATVTFVPAADQWTGEIRCEINVTGDGYSHQETQNWRLTGAAPTQQGSMTIYPASWSAVGQGWHDRTNASGSRRISSWTANVSGQSAPIAFVLPPSGELFVQLWHAQLTAPGGYVGTDQYIQNGVTQVPQRLTSTLYEWQFQRIPGQPSDTQLKGSHTVQSTAFLGPLQPGGAQVTVTCTWALGRGSAPPLPAATLPKPPLPPGSSAPAARPTFAQGRSGGIIDRPSDGDIISPPQPVIGPPRDPTNFTAMQTGAGRVELRWDAVSGVTNYTVLGPGASEGRKVNATSTVITDLPPGRHEWLVTSWYEPDGSRTDAGQWPRARLNVTSASGRYRVTATRLRIHQEEPDNRTKFHGKNNEIFLTEHSQVIDRRTGANRAYDGLVSHPDIAYMIHSTPIHGDIANANTAAFQYRIRAGSVSSTGGIQTGDEFQIWDADQMRHRSQTFGAAGFEEGVASHPSPGVFLSSEYQPFVLWEGDLNAGAEVALLRPMVWLAVNTWRGDTIDPFLRPYVGRTADERSHAFLALPAIRDALNQLQVLVTKVPELTSRGDWLVDRHRPFGLEVNENRNGAPATWTDTVVVLTQEKVESLLAGNPGAELELRFRGTMGGQNPIPMGDCSLFLKIERLPMPPSPSSPRDGLPGAVDVAPPRPIEAEGAAPDFAQATKGKYRITGTRVLIHREEHDQRHKEHGRNNEISVSKHALVINRRTNAKVAFDPGVVVSPVHGDQNNTMTETLYTEYRIRAGSVSASGGIQTGDDVVVWTTAGKPSNARVPSSECIPFVFWEGELNDGGEVLLIRPVVWLISGWLWHNAAEFLAPYMIRVSNEQWTDFLSVPPIRDALSAQGISIVSVPQLVTVGGWRMETHRPFGIKAQPGTVGEPYGSPSTWTDRVVILTREKIQASLGRSREMFLEVRFQSTITAPVFNMGDCSLFLKIERLQ